MSETNRNSVRASATAARQSRCCNGKFPRAVILTGETANAEWTLNEKKRRPPPLRTLPPPRRWKATRDNEITRASPVRSPLPPYLTADGGGGCGSAIAAPRWTLSWCVRAAVGRSNPPPSPQPRLVPLCAPGDGARVQWSGRWPNGVSASRNAAAARRLRTLARRECSFPSGTRVWMDDVFIRLQNTRSSSAHNRTRYGNCAVENGKDGFDTSSGRIHVKMGQWTQRSGQIGVLFSFNFGWRHSIMEPRGGGNRM